MREIGSTISVLARFLLIPPILAGCGYGPGGGDAVPSISIETPTATPTYTTTQANVRIGGAISGASFVHVHNVTAGFGTEGFVFYSEGQGTWFADVSGLVPGDNVLTATADADGTGARTASASITVFRSQTADLIINGSDQASASTFWTDMNSFNSSHKIAIFGDGTGRSTTGSVLSENAMAVSGFTWSKLGPDSILISNCLTCSFQRITRISGSFGESVFYGQVESVGGTGEAALHVFTSLPGSL